MRARRTREVAEAKAKDDRPADAPGRAQPARDTVDEADEGGVDLLVRPPRRPERALGADRAPAPAAQHRARVAVVRERVQMAAGCPAEQEDE